MLETETDTTTGYRVGAMDAQWGSATVGFTAYWNEDVWGNHGR